MRHETESDRKEQEEEGEKVDKFLTPVEAVEL